MTWAAYVGIAIAVGLGAFIQGSVGFAFGLFSIPCVVLCGLPLEQAITLILTLVLVQTASATWRYRREIPWSDVIHLTAYRFAAIPLGVWLLVVMKSRCSPAQIKQFVGLMILLALTVQWRTRRKPRAEPRLVWTPIAGLASGLFAGLVGMGGPPLVLWLAARDWSTQRTRALLWTLFLLMVPWQLLVMYWQFRDPIPRSMLLAVFYMPVVFVGGWLGTNCGDRLTRTRLRTITYVLLLWIAVFSILDPMW
jgi:uncharacterized membrane protein YfcA